MTVDYSEIGQRIAKRRRELGLRQYRIIGMCGLRRNFASKFVGKSAGILAYFKDLTANLGAKGQARRTFDYCAVLP